MARQRNADRDHEGGQALLVARVHAVAAAQRALRTGEEDAGYVLRAALVDLAAAAELVAEELPRPTLP